MQKTSEAATRLRGSPLRKRRRDGGPQSAPFPSDVVVAKVKAKG